MLRIRRLSRITLTAGLAAVLSFVPLSAAVADCSAAEVGYVATFKVKPGSEAGLEAALTALAATVNEVESGVVLYAPFKGVDGAYYMMERYVDEAARKAHGSSPEVQAMFPALGAHLAGAPDVQPVSAVCP